MDLYDITLKCFLVFIGLAVFVGIPGWFVIDIIQRRRQGLPILDLGSSVSTVILYQPDEILKVRTSVDALVGFIQLIQAKCLPSLERQSQQPFELVVGIKPGRKARFWVISKAGPLSVDDFGLKFGTLQPPDVTGPVAFALSCGRKADSGLPIPDEWTAAIANQEHAVQIPDDVFSKIWNDDS